ncbi:hypothetical protein K1719_017935 [Acacia pycnantha]|nr:hypothetical protein K1719_017935 [Acacia pycnantha]
MDASGDFNEIKSPMEQKGGGRTNEVRCRRFQNWIQGCNLIDLDAKGPFFTWKGPKWEGLDRVYKRLDRCMCNVKWHEQFVNAVIKVLPRLCSDHHPLFVQLNGQNQEYRARNFRYEAMWQMHENFVEVVNESWRGEDEAHVKLNRLQENLICWNKEVFGRVATRKKQLFNRLYGIQRSIERVLSGKYGRQKDFKKEGKVMKTDSELWKSLEGVWQTVIDNLSWELGNGENVSFWKDKWIEGDKSLADMCPGQVTEEEGRLRK